MKVAVIGPVVKDIVHINNITKTYIGGIPYYEAHVLKALGVDVTAFVTYALSEQSMVDESFKDIKVNSVYVEKTIVHEIVYKDKDADLREVKVSEYDPNVFPVEDEIIKELQSFDYILLGPLYFENISYDFFEIMKNSNLVLGNFGLFTYYENGIPVKKNPENLAKVAPFLKYLFLDEVEIKFCAQKETIEECADYFINLGVNLVVVTQGSKGSVIFTKDKKYNIPAFVPKELIDPTGAGDTYLAAFIYSEEIFNDMQKRGEFAAMCATMSIEKGGAFDGNTEGVLERLRRNNK
ncbi:MAG: PfkB protein [Patescibacteria group bacterium]|nr:PfkB protein [Patescibacteria group bacterium]